MTLPLSSDISNYGGLLVDAVPIVDPSSEVSASSLNNERTDTALMTRVSTRCVFQFTGSATAPAVASTPTWTVGNDAVWGNASGVTPLLTRSTTGVVNVQFPSTVTSPVDGVSSIGVVIRNGKAFVGGATCSHAQVTVTSASQATVYLFNASGSPSDLAGMLILVEVF